MIMNNHCIMSFDNKLKIKEYAEGYRIFDLRCGSSRGREWKSSVFFFLALGMLFILMLNGFDISRIPVAAIVLLICMYMCSYYLYMLPKKAKLRGEHIFKSSKLLRKEYSFDLYKDYFTMKNEYEYTKKYYTELSDCIETDSIFVLIGGIEDRLTVIAKKSMNENDRIELSRIFKREMPDRYRRMGRIKNGKNK